MEWNGKPFSYPEAPRACVEALLQRGDLRRRPGRLRAGRRRAELTTCPGSGRSLLAQTSGTSVLVSRVEEVVPPAVEGPSQPMACRDSLVTPLATPT